MCQGKKSWGLGIAFRVSLCQVDASAALPDRCYAVPGDAFLPDFISIADVVLGKLGYGTCSEALHCRKPMVYVPRRHFVEEPGLQRLMAARGCAVPLSQEQFLAGNWGAALEHAVAAGRVEPGIQASRDPSAGHAGDTAADQVAQAVLALIPAACLNA